MIKLIPETMPRQKQFLIVLTNYPQMLQSSICLWCRMGRAVKKQLISLSKLTSTISGWNGTTIKLFTKMYLLNSCREFQSCGQTVSAAELLFNYDGHWTCAVNVHEKRKQTKKRRNYPQQTSKRQRMTELLKTKDLGRIRRQVMPLYYYSGVLSEWW